MILFACILVGSNDECGEKQEQIEEESENEYDEKENENVKPKKRVSNTLHNSVCPIRINLFSWLTLELL